MAGNRWALHPSLVCERREGPGTKGEGVKGCEKRVELGMFAFAVGEIHVFFSFVIVGVCNSVYTIHVLREEERENIAT